MRRMINLAAAVAAAIVTLFAVPPIVAAVEGVIQPGASCVPVGHTNFEYTDQIRVDHTGTSVAQDFTCPVPTHQSSSDTFTHNGTVRVVDHHSTANFSCRLWSLDFGGSSYNSGATGASSGESAAIQNVTVGAVSLQSSAIKSVRCSVPPVESGDRSRIYGYHVVW